MICKQHGLLLIPKRYAFLKIAAVIKTAPLDQRLRLYTVPYIPRRRQTESKSNDPKQKEERHKPKREPWLNHPLIISPVDPPRNLAVELIGCGKVPLPPLSR
jgi:hypothetical protein